MRLIDADKLLARYKERCAGCKETKNYCEHCCDLADVISDIEDAPTLEAKGKWIIDGHHIECNQCGAYMCDKDREGDKFPINFCPCCGADMRGDGNDEK